MLFCGLLRAFFTFTVMSSSGRVARRGLVAALLLPLLAGLQLEPAHAQSPGVTLSGPVSAEGHGIAPPEEGGTNVYNYCVVLDAAPSQDVVVTATPSPAIVTVDAALTFTPSNWSDKQCFTVRAASSADNADDEPDRAVTMTHAAASTDAGYNGIAIADYTGVSLRDDDATVVSLARIGSGSIAEGVVGDKARFTVSLGRALAAGETVIAPLDFSPWAAPGQPGLQPSDFVVTLASGAGVRLAGPIQDCWVVFEAGAQVATLELAAVRDGIADDGERISVGLGAASRFDDAAHGYSTDVGGGGQPHATAHEFETVLKDSHVTVRFDMPRNPRFGGNIRPEGGPVTVEEGEALTVSLSLSKPLPAPVTIHLSSLDQPTNYFYYKQAVAGVDYTAGPWTVTFAAGDTRASIDIQTTEDTDIEGPNLKREGFDISLDRSRLPPDVRLSGPQVFTFLIEDDDMAIVAFARERQTVWENAGTVLIPVTVERTLSTPFALEYLVSRKSNEDGRWYRLGWEEVTVPANAATVDIPFTIVDDDVQEEDELITFELFSAKARRHYNKDIFHLTIRSDDGPPLLMSGISDAIVEHNSDWRAQARVRNATGAVTWTLSGADASAFAIDAATGAISLPVQDYGTPADADGDNVYKATVTATDTDGRTVSTAFKVTVAAARLRFVGKRGAAGIYMVRHDITEGEVLTLTLELSQALSEPFTVTLEDHRQYRGVMVGHQATRGADYPVMPWSATFPAGATRATASFPTNRDTDNSEPSRETLFLSMVASSLPAGVVVRDERQVSDRVAFVRIRNVAGRGPFVSFASTSSEVQEDAGTVSLDVTVDPPPATPFALNFSLSGTATPGDGGDYRISGVTGDRPIEGVTGNSGTVTVPANVGSVTIPVEIIDDTVEDDGETIVVSLSESAGYAAATPDSVTLTIRNDDTPLNAVTDGTDPVTPAVDAALVAEVAALADGHSNPDAAARLRRVVKGMTGEDGGYTAEECRETATRHGVLSTWKPWCDEIARREAQAPPEPQQQQTVTLPAVSVSAGADVTEGGDATFTVTASPAPASALSVTVTVAAEGEFGITAGSRSVKIPTTGSAVLTLTTAGDDADEPDGSVSVTVATGEGYTVGDPVSGTVVIADDDPAPAVATVDAALVAEVTALADGHSNPDAAARLRRVVKGMTGEDGGYTAEECREAATRHGVLSTWKPWCDEIARREAQAPPEPQQQQVVTLPAVTVSAGADVTEGGDAVFTVTANPAPAADLAVTVTVATAGEFGVTAGSQPVTIPTTGSATLTLTTAGDDTDEPDGSVSVTVAAGDGYTVGDPASGTVAIADDDLAPPLPAITVSAGDAVTEGGDAVFTVTASPAPASPLAVSVTVATKGDYGIASGTQTVSIPTTGSATLTLTTAGDDTDEPDGSVSVTVAAGSGYTVGDPASGTVAVQDDDAPLPGITIAAGTSPVTEGGDAAFTVTASPAPAAELAVTVTVAVDGDYGVTAGKQTVTIPATGSATLTLATAGDDIDEPDGSVSVTVATGNGYTVGDPASGTVAVQDDDVPAITVSAGDAVTEGGDAVFTVTANPAPASPLAVSVTVAVRGDYGIASGTQTVSIPATGSAVLTLATSDDAADEPDGSVSVTVAAGEGYTVGDPASGSVSIADDDLPPPVVSIAAKAASVTEGGTAAFTLTADRAPDADLTVTLSVAETGGGDHVAAADEGPATAVIAKGATEAVFSVATVDDDVDEPDGSVTVTLKDGGGYTVPSPPGNAAAVTVSDNDAAVGPVLSVDDATGQENGRLPAMPFTVRLSAPAQDAVRVYVSTRPSTPVSATPKVDYTPASYYLLFRAGETEKQVWVMIHNDSHDEEPETFEVVLSKAQGAPVGDGVAVATIVNDDPMPAAWLARFGRAVAEQALDGIAARMTADRTPGLRGTIAGQALDFGGNAAVGPDLSRSPGSRGTGPGLRAGGAGGAGPGLLFGSDVEAQSRGMTMQEALRGSSFSLTGEADGSGGTLSFWGGSPGSGGLVSGSQFAGSQRGDGTSVRLDGETGAALLGTDYARGRWLVGFALSQVRAEGGYAGEGGSDCSGLPASVPASACAVAARAGDGEVEASLTATIPYAALAVSDRLRLWGAAGQGAGDVTVKTAPGSLSGAGSGGSYRADTAWSMAAAGLRGDLLAPPAPGSRSGAGSGTGPALALTSDALWVRTSSEKTGDLAASESDVSRLRVGLEGSWGVALSGGGSVTPKLELGARHDGGDAETGFGVELGGGLAWRDPKLGLTLDLSGRTLVAHDDGGLEDRGVSARLSYDPEPSSGRGLSLSLGQDWGGRAQGGLDALFQPEPLEDRAGSGGGHEATSRWAMEAAWGLPVLGGRFTGSPYMGLGLATGARDYSLGWRLTPESANAPGLSFGLRATRRESDAQAPEHTVGGEIAVRW